MTGVQTCALPICSDEALEKAVKLDGGLQEKLRGVKESTGHIWESTKKRTKELGSTVNKPIARIKRTKKDDPDSPDADKPGNNPPQENPPN